MVESRLRTNFDQIWLLNSRTEGFVKLFKKPSKILLNKVNTSNREAQPIPTSCQVDCPKCTDDQQVARLH